MDCQCGEPFCCHCERCSEPLCYDCKMDFRTRPSRGGMGFLLNTFCPVCHDKAEYVRLTQELENAKLDCETLDCIEDDDDAPFDIDLTRSRYLDRVRELRRALESYSHVSERLSDPPTPPASPKANWQKEGF